MAAPLISYKDIINYLNFSPNLSQLQGENLEVNKYNELEKKITFFSKIQVYDFTPEQAELVFNSAIYALGGVTNLVEVYMNNKPQDDSIEFKYLKLYKKLKSHLTDLVEALEVLKEPEANRIYNQILNDDFSSFEKIN